MTEFAWDYAKLAFLGTLGAIQIACAYGGLRGLLYFQNRLIAALVGVALVATAFLWFFLSGPRNVPDTTFGLNGNQQSKLFAGAASVAVVFTLLTSSLRNVTMDCEDTANVEGFDALRHTTFWRVFGLRVKKAWKLYSSRLGKQI